MSKFRKSNPWQKARFMAIDGYVTRIIILETGLSDKQVRRVYRNLDAEKAFVKREANHSTRTRSGATLVTNLISKIHASYLMFSYDLIKKGCYDFISMADIERTHQMYLAIIHEVSQYKAAIKKMTLTISDTWCLASELRSKEAMFETCKNCQCVYFTSVHQSTCIECPFCFEAMHPRKNSQSTSKPCELE